MRIKFVQISNFRKLKSTHIDFDGKTTVLVGANNSGKTSAMVALRYFLLAPERLSLRDVTISHWIQIDELGKAWEEEREVVVQLDSLLPSLDVWLEAQLAEIQYLVQILPTLDWAGGLLGVRLKFQVKSEEKLKAEYLLHRKAARDAAAQAFDGENFKLQVWPKCLTDFLEKRLRKHVELKAFSLDPAAWVPPQKGLAVPQVLPTNAIPLENDPLKTLIKVDEIAAQRDFADAGEAGQAYGTKDSSRYKRRLSEQLRSYYDQHIDPSKVPSVEDYEALGAIQSAQVNFDKRLAEGFAAAFKELEDLGYPGIANPKIKISTHLHGADGLRHNSAVQYQIADPAGDGTTTLRLPEDYSGLGFQNLVAMAFMLMSFRDDWMRVGKAALAFEPDEQEPIQRIHLVLVEEPEAHLHAQVQQVFINKAYDLLRKHDELHHQDDLQTQLVVSTHSSHVAHEVDFSSLRYFRRRPASSPGEIPTTTIANLSEVFGGENETYRFVKRYLKSTHCDLFFADGVIFVEGQAERILVPHFIRYHFPSLSRRYITLLDIGGSHAHAFKDLVDELGVATLIIGDLDAVVEKTVPVAGKGEAIRWVAAQPRQGTSQRTSNPVLKEWHPAKLLIDDLVSLSLEQQESSSTDGYRLFVTYQKPVTNDLGHVVIPRTFEDALIFENLDLVRDLRKSSIGQKVNSFLAGEGASRDLESELFDLLKTAEKAAFAIDCLMIDDPLSLKPPRYVRDGLGWFERVVGEGTAEILPPVVPA